MNSKTALLLLVVACVGYTVSENTEDPTAPTSATDPPASTVITHPTSNSTVVTSTTIETTQHSTAAPTSTGASTTAGPTHAPTTPIPVPSKLWGAHYENGSYCILLKADISIEFRYKNPTNQTISSKLTVPPYVNTTAHGSCKSEHQSITIEFFTNWTLTLGFKKANDSKHYMSDVQLVWNLTNTPVEGLPDISGVAGNTDPKFSTSKTGYLCLAKASLYDNSSIEIGVFSIYTEHLQVESFQVKSKAEFSESFDRCKEDTISNLVPIIVGACLGGLIIIVLVAYLIGRKRSRRGYESV